MIDETKYSLQVTDNVLASRIISTASHPRSNHATLAKMVKREIGEPFTAIVDVSTFHSVNVNVPLL